MRNLSPTGDTQKKSYLAAIIPSTPRFRGWKMQRVNGVTGGCDRYNCISITAAME